MQGDGYSLAIEILNNADQPVTPTDIIDVEICIGKLRKTYRNQEVSYGSGVWLFPLSQNETLRFPPYPVDCQVRVLWSNGVVEGQKLQGIRVWESISKEVL